MRRKMVSWLLAAAGCVVCATVVVSAGPLDPPAGPVASTYKTLAEVEARTAISAVNTPGDANSVFKITASGSYYLTGDVVGVAGKVGIQVTASFVTIDLNGFTLDGRSLGTSGVFAGVSDVTVRNGHLKAWLQRAIFCGDEAVVRGVDVAACADGIFTGASFLVDACNVAFCGGTAISTGCCGVIHSCGIRNAATGIMTGSSVEFSDCLVTECSSTGILAGAACQVHDCDVSFGGPSGIGIQAGVDSSVAACNVFCVGGDGILTVGPSNVRANNIASTSTGGAGIKVQGSDAVVEGNNVSKFGIGYDIQTAGNLITGNRCTGSATNYNIVANNRYGGIVDVSAAGGAAVSGKAAVSTLSTIDPHANFSY